MAASDQILTSGASGRVNALLSVRAWRTLIRLIAAIVVFFVGPFRGRRRPTAVAVAASVAKEEKIVAGSGALVRLPAAIVPRRVAEDQEVAARRSMAIRRVKEDSNCDRSVRDFLLFTSPRGATLFTQSWTPFSRNVRGLIVLLHGLNEHSGRYSEFAKQLNDIGIKVYGMDWIGHGGSDGLHGFVHSLDDAVGDLVAFLDHVLSENPGIPCFCVAHSTGAAIVLKAALDPKVARQIRGLVLTSPAVGVRPSHPVFSVIAPIVSLLFPRYQCRAANKSGTVVSRDPEALLAKYSDPLVYTGAIRVRTGYEILRISTYFQKNLMRLRAPFFVLHGSADAVTDPEGSKRLYEEASSTDKMFKLYDGLLHDLLFEPERRIVAQDMIGWINQRIED